MADLSDIKSLLVSQGDGIAEIKRQTDALELDVATLKLNNKAGTPAPETASASAPTVWREVKTGRPIRVLGHNERLSSVVEHDRNVPAPSIGRFARGLALASEADDAAELAEERKALGISPDPSGGYTVPASLSAQWIDALRAEMVLSRAGVRTVPMDSASLSIARLEQDPVATWHQENAAIDDTEPTFGRVLLQSKTVVAVVRGSVELFADSTNADAILTQSITRALAGAIDKAGLVGETTNAAIAPAGIFNTVGRNRVTSIGAPTTWDYVIDGMAELMLDDVPTDRVAMIAHPALWKKMTKLKVGPANDNTPIPAPAEVAAVPKYYTTAAPFVGGNSVNAILGDFRDVLMGVRSQVSVRIVREAYLASHLQLAVVAFARVDFAVARPQSLATLEGISV